MNFSDNYNNLLSLTEDLSQYSLEQLESLLHTAKDIQSQYKNLQLVVKCNANSLYGVSASIFFSLHDVDVAEDITLTGKHFAVSVDIAINNFFKNWGDTELQILKEFYPDLSKIRPFTEYIPDTKDDLCSYGDTDSRYVNLEMIYGLMFDKDNNQMKIPIDDKELADFACFIVDKFLNKVIKDTIDYECEYRNARKGFLKMTHEVTTRKTIFLKKKKYIMNPIWEDGKMTKGKKLKFKGVELKKGTSSPRIKKIIEKLLNKDIFENYTLEQIRVECLKLIQYIKSIKEKDMIYAITTVSGFDAISFNEEKNKFVSDKNHIQMQIALSWLNFIHTNNLKHLYKPPFEGQKMMYYYTANPNMKVIGIPDDVDINKIQDLPEVDWNAMIKFVFIKPLLRYISETVDVTDEDVDNFLLGVKKLSFLK